MFILTYKNHWARRKFCRNSFWENSSCLNIMTRWNRLKTRHQIFKVFIKQIGWGSCTSRNWPGRVNQNHKQLWQSLLRNMYVILIEPKVGVPTNWRKPDKHIENFLTVCGTSPPCHWSDDGKLWWSCA